MKKNYFKKLAITMAFAMVFTSTAPAAPVSAAKKPALNATSKVLLLNGKGSYDFNIKNKVKGSTYKWTSSNKKVATVNSKGLTKAVATGTSKVTVAIKTKAGKTIKLTAKVTVKENAQSVKIDSVSDAAIQVDQAYTLKATTTTKTGKATTDIVRWEVTSGKENATVTDDGVFTAKTAGEYKVVARTFQSKTQYNAFLNGDATKAKAVSEAVTIKVAAAMTGVKQENTAKAVVSFNSAMTDVAKNISVYSLVGTTKVKQTVKSVSMDATNKVATVELYVPFVGGTTYVVDYTDMKSVQFDAATTKVEDVTALKIATTEVVFNKASDIDVKIFNKDGVDITTTELKQRLTLATSLDKSFLDGNKLTIFNKGDATTITATFHTYKYDTTTGTETGNIVASGVVTAVDAVTVAPGALQAFTIVKPNDQGVYSPDFNDVKHAVAAEDAGYRLFVKVKKGDNNITSIDAAEIAKFTFESSNKDILNVSSEGILSPNKEGAAVIIVKYDKTVVDAITVNVSAKRKATDIKLDSYSFSLSKTTNFVDSKTVKLEVVDQLGTGVTLENVSYEKLTGAPGNDDLTVTHPENNKFVFAANGKTAGTYYYKIKANGLSKTVAINVLEPSSLTANNYKVELGTTSIDAAVKSDSTTKNVSVNLFGYAANGVKTTQENVTGAGYVVKVTNPDGNTTTVTSSSFDVVTAVSGGAYTKIKTGTYRFNLFKIEDGKEIAQDTAYGVRNFDRFRTRIIHCSM